MPIIIDDKRKIDEKERWLGAIGIDGQVVIELRSADGGEIPVLAFPEDLLGELLEQLIEIQESR